MSRLTLQGHETRSRGNHKTRQRGSEERREGKSVCKQLLGNRTGRVKGREEDLGTLSDTEGGRPLLDVQRTLLYLIPHKAGV